MNSSTRSNVEHRAVLIRARVATSLLFLLFGTALGTWTSRIPAVKAGLGVDDGGLSIALLAFAVGAILGMVVLGRLVDRFGSTRVMVPTAVLEGLLLIPPAFVPSLPTLVVALLAFGAVHGTLNIAMNANAIEVQRTMGRPIMSSFHAVYSIGGFLGAGIGGLFAQAEFSAGTTFVVTGGLVLVLAVWATLWALPASVRTPVERPEIRADQPRRTFRQRYDLLLLGVLAMFALVGEGTAADWSAVYLRDNLHTTAGFAASAFAAFSIMMTAGRLVGDRLVALLGPVLLVRISGIVASVGMTAALLVNQPVAAVIGFGCLGAGMSCIAPQVYSAAGNRDPARAGQALSQVVSMGYAGFLIGPILIGGASTIVGLPQALGIPSLLVLLVAVGAFALRPVPSTTEH